MSVSNISSITLKCNFSPATSVINLPCICPRTARGTPRQPPLRPDSDRGPPEAPPSPRPPSIFRTPAMSLFPPLSEWSGWGRKFKWNQAASLWVLPASAIRGGSDFSPRALPASGPGVVVATPALGRRKSRWGRPSVAPAVCSPRAGAPRSHGAELH